MNALGDAAAISFLRKREKKRERERERERLRELDSSSSHHITQENLIKGGKAYSIHFHSLVCKTSWITADEGGSPDT